jgi:hypothetical protein
MALDETLERACDLLGPSSRSDIDDEAEFVT